MSMYNFWKYESNYKVCTKVVPKSEGLPEFIEYVKRGSSCLNTLYTNPDHTRAQIHWIPRDTWSSTIVIRYVPNLNSVIEPLLKELGIPRTGPYCPRNNITTKKEPIEGLDLTWVREHYRADFELWDAVNEHPELFKKVI
jgi:hypothetical protein